MNRLRFLTPLAMLALAALACATFPTSTADLPELPDTAPIAELPTEAPPEAVDDSGSGAPKLIPVSGPCNNPYYPIVPDVTWTYRMTSSDSSETSIYRYHFDNITDNGFTSVIVLESGTGEVFNAELDFTCDENGITQAEYSTLDISGLPEGFTVETVSVEGTTFAVPERWTPGQTWESVYNLNMQMDTGLAGMMDVETVLTTVSTVIGNEAVSVPLGDFGEAVRVDQTYDMVTTMAGLGDFDMGSEEPATLWFVRDLGMVRNESSAYGVTSVMELLSVE